jgi:hypothetical protein
MERSIRVYFSGYVERKLSNKTTDDEIYDIKEQLSASLTPAEIGSYMTEDDWNVWTLTR